MSKLKETIEDYMQKNDMLVPMSPFDDKMVEFYIDTAIKKLPNLYRLLEEENILPKNSSYHKFIQVFMYRLEEERQISIFREINGR